jgi:adenosylmethionine-8-amino-7-oxononanoate aminotransferase
MVKDRETRASFTPSESELLIRRVLSESLLENGLICRADDRGDPVIQLSPPLIAGPEHFAEIVTALRAVLLRGMAELAM